MPPDAEIPASRDSEALPEPGVPSFGDKMRNFMLGIGSIGIELGSLGAGPSPYGNDAGHEPIGESKRAKTWYGRILQWAWAILILLVGIVVFLFMIVLGIGWVMSWFD